MAILAVFKPSNPSDLLEIYGILITFVLVLFLVSELSDWLKSKPWKHAQAPQTPNTNPLDTPPLA